MTDSTESNQNPQVQNPSGTDGNAQPAPKTTESPDIQKLIQASEDRVRTQYSKELKAQQAIIEELRSKTMSESEIRKHKEQLLSEREQTLARKELELLAVDVLRENEVPMSLREFVIGKDADETKARAAALKTEFQKAVEAAVQERFKQAGRDPAKASDPPAAGKGKIYTRAEVDELSKKVTNPTTPEAEKKAIQADLLAAMREGRIRN